MIIPLLCSHYPIITKCHYNKPILVPLWLILSHYHPLSMIIIPWLSHFITKSHYYSIITSRYNISFLCHSHWSPFHQPSCGCPSVIKRGLLENPRFSSMISHEHLHFWGDFQLLVGGFNPSEKYWSNGSSIPHIWKNNHWCSKPPTSH